MPEIDRQQNHISKIDPNHPLKQVFLDCLKDRDIECPSAQQLCERVAALKEDPQYSESMGAVEARSSAEQDRSDERDRELRSLRQQHSLQVQGFQQIIQSQNETITQKDETIAELREQTKQLDREKGVVIEEKERELRQKAGEIDWLERQLGHVNQ